MARFHLHISADGHEETDGDGHEFNDLRHAVAAAGKTAGELLYDMLRDRPRPLTLAVRVCDADNREQAIVTAECRLSEQDQNLC